MLTFIHRFAGLFQLLFVVAVVGAAVMLSVSLRPDEARSFTAPAAQAMTVSVIRPVEQSYRPTVRLNGIVEARTRTEVIPQVSGRVIEVSPHFRAGAQVSAGDVLFRIDPADYELAVERTLAEIEAARSELALLEAQATAERQIWNSQSPDRKIPDLIARVPQIAAAKARIHSAEAARDAASIQLQRTVVRTPFDARILDTRLEIGQVVSSGARVGSAFSVDSLEIAAPVSLDELILIGEAIGQQAAIVKEGMHEADLNGEVIRQAAALNERTRLSTLYISVDDAKSLILGEFVAVEITGQDTPKSFRVPSAALTSRDQVWVVNDGKVEERTVNVLGNEDGYVVVSAFEFADGIVAIPPADVRAGLPVSIDTERGLATANGGSNAGSK
jgi:RND family efflux transporter MFP subunit